MKYCVRLSVVFVAVVSLLIINHHVSGVGKVYEKEYFRKIGINKSLSYNDVVESKGTPVSEREERNENDLLYVYYKDCVLTFDKNSDEGKGKYFLMNAKIITSKYKFGKCRIGVGSSCEKVKKAYQGIPGIKDIKNIGYVDGSTWVEFEFDTNKKVSSILIYYGP